MEQTITRVIERGIVFTQHRSDYAFCAPAREAILTGNSSLNHLITSNNNASYYPYCREGRRGQRTVVGGTLYPTGPWERDLAKRAGLADTPVDPLTGQGAVAGYVSGTTLRASQVLRADANDDLQAYTGCLPNWLASAGVTAALIGKYQNALAVSWAPGASGGPTTGNGIGYLDGQTRAAVAASASWLASNLAAQGVDPVVALNERYVPPGWAYWRCLVGQDLSTFGGGAQDHWLFAYARYAGVNNPAGDGVEATDLVASVYSNIVSITRVGSVATVAFTGHGMTAGAEFAMNNTNDPLWEGTTLTVATVIDANHFTYALASNPAATTAGGTPKCFPRRNYGEGRWQEEAATFIQSRRDDEPWFVYYAPDNPHSGIVGSSDDSTVEVEQRYLNTVATADAWCFNGVPGWLPDKSAPCTGAVGGTRISNAGRRHDGSGPFTQDDIGKLVTDQPVTATGYAATGTAVTLDVSSSVACVVGDQVRVLCPVPALCGTWTLTAVSTGLMTFTVPGMTTTAHTGFVGSGVGSVGRVLGTVGSADDALPGGTGGYIDLAGGATVRSTLGYVCFGDQITTIGEVTLGRQQYWQRRQEMCASVDDTIGVFLDECEARGWTNVTVILTGDNGQQTGEWQFENPGQDYWNNSKTTAYEGSIRSFLAVRHPPWWAAGQVANFPTSMCDLTGTILDFFAEYPPFAALANHHAHTKRDGVSIARLLADPTTAATRATLIHDGDFGNKSDGQGIVVQRVAGFAGVAKLIRSTDGTLVRLHDVENDGTSYKDYDRTNLAATYPAIAAALGARLDNLRVGRWDPQHSGGPAQTFRTA